MQSTETKKNEFVYLIQRFGQVIGVYRTQSDALQVLNQYLSNGQTADFSVKPLL